MTLKELYEKHPEWHDLHLATKDGECFGYFSEAFCETDIDQTEETGTEEGIKVLVMI